MANLERLAHRVGMRALGDGTARVTNGFFRALGAPGRYLQDLLNGIWLGHTAHSVAVDVPMGSFTALFVLDVLSLFFGVQGLETASVIVLAVGYVGGIGAVLTGLTDHKDADDDRPFVTLHGLVQVTAMVVYTVSLVIRLGGNFDVARWVAIGGYVVIGFGAFLGGHIVYKLGYMVNRNAHVRGGRAHAFTAVLPAAELLENTPTRASLGPVRLVLVRRGDAVHAMNERCSHVGGPLSRGTIEGDAIVCPWHQSTFRLRDGTVKHGPAHTRQPMYEARILADQVEVRGPVEV